MTTTTTNLNHRFGDTVGVCDLCGHVRYEGPRTWLCPVAVAESTLEARQAWLKNINAYYMASIAEISDPSSLSSPGAEMLETVRSYLLESLEYDAEKPVPISELADSVLPVYTHDIWETFVDLCAYNEDVEDLGGDMTERAKYALYSIAHRLLHTLCDMLNFTTDMD
jgi:hypothetical protein